MKEKIQSTVKAFLDVEEPILIPIHPKNRWHAFLQRIGIAKKELCYTLKKIRVGNREKIGLRSENIPNDLNDGKSLINKILELSAKNTSDFIYCAAVALQNDKNEPSEELLDALKWVDDDFLYQILEKSISQIDVENFLKSIVLIKGTTSLMKTESQ